MGSCKRKNEEILTLTERKTRKEIIVKIDSNASEAVKTITYAEKWCNQLSRQVATWKFIKGAFLCKNI